MNRRRITRHLGAAAGGLGAAFLPVAFAHADAYDITPDMPGHITGIYGLIPAAPAETESVQTSGALFDWHDLTSGGTGSFGADASTSADPLGIANQVVYVTGPGSPSTDGLPDGSVFDTYSASFLPGFSAVYSAIPTTGGADAVSGTLETPFGNLSIPFPLFDAATVADSDVGDSALADVFGFSPASDNVISAVTGSPPEDFVTQGAQTFDTAGGSFDADTTTTSDIFTNTTEAFLVTSDSGTPGTGAGDVPPVGSVYNVFNLFGYSGFKEIYSAIPSTTGGADVVSNTLVTPFGNVNIPIPDSLDAAALTHAGTTSVPLAGGYDLVSAGPEDWTGINGVPPLDAAIQGTQPFEVANSAGNVAETFNADVSSTVDPFGDTDEAILVLASSDYPDALISTPAGDVLPAGSQIYVDTLTDLGIKNILTDIPTTPGGADVFSDTLMTPFGDYSIPISDALAGLGVVDSLWEPLLTSLTSLF